MLNILQILAVNQPLVLVRARTLAPSEDTDNYYRLDQSAEVGNVISAKGGIRAVSGNNLTVRQSDISSESGEVLLGSRKGDVRIEAGRAEETLETGRKSTGRGLLSKTTSVHRYEHDISEAVGSNIDGRTVKVVSSSGDVVVKSSSVVGDEALTIYGKNDVSIVSDVNTHYQDELSMSKKSGLLGSGFGFTIGSKKEQIEQDRRQQSAARSQVGSLSGDTAIYAGNHYQQTGSVVTSRDGDVDILAKTATVTAARSDYESNYKRTVQQKGFTFAVSSPVTNAIQAVEKSVNSAKSVGSSKNDRINALGAVNAGVEGWRTAEQVGKLAEAISENPMQAMSQDIGLSVSYGSQKSTQREHRQGNNVEKSQVNAGGKVSIRTEGAGKDSVLNVIGSDVGGKGGTKLSSQGDVNILAIDENHLERSENKSGGFNAGVAIQFGGTGSPSFGVTAGGNTSKGYGNGESRAWVGSRVGSQLSKTEIDSGNTANIIGSQVQGKRVEVKAKDLNIQSLQDTMSYKGKQESVQGQITIGYGASASGGYNNSKMNANYASVTQQAGIFAGDEGYDIDIANHSDLKGGLVTSTDNAEAENRNRFSTGTLSYSHIDNQSSHKGSAVDVSASVAANFDTPFGDKGIAQSNKQAVNEEGEKLYQTANGNQTTEAKSGDKANKPILAHGWNSLTGDISMGFGSDKDSQSSQTISGINTQNLIIRDEQGQLEKTGKTIEQIKEEIKTDITTETAESRSGKLENRFDKEKVLKEIQTQVSVTKDFLDNAQEAKDKVIDYYQEPKRKELREAITDYHNANIESKEQYKAKIDELIQDIYTLEHIRTGLDLATGVVAGAPKVMSATTLISVLDTESRRESLKNSLLAPPIEDVNDKGKLYSNVGHNSGAFDGVKLGGVRMNYGIICGVDNSRCETDEQGNLKRNEKGHIVYRGDKELKYPTITRLLEDRNVSGKLFGATGGFQAVEGEMFGIKYRPGSFLDKLTETYAGQHDLVGGQLFFYDKEGNGNRNLTDRQIFWIDRAAEAAVLGVTPTTVPHALPLEIRFLLFGVR